MQRISLDAAAIGSRRAECWVGTVRAEVRAWFAGLHFLEGKKTFQNNSKQVFEKSVRQPPSNETGGECGVEGETGVRGLSSSTSKGEGGDGAQQ